MKTVNFPCTVGSTGRYIIEVVVVVVFVISLFGVAPEGDFLLVAFLVVGRGEFCVADLEDGDFERGGILLVAYREDMRIMYVCEKKGKVEIQIMML